MVLEMIFKFILFFLSWCCACSFTFFSHSEWKILVDWELNGRMSDEQTDALQFSLTQTYKLLTGLSLVSSQTAFGEAFITTFRTFITPLDLIEKLTHRYTIFCCQVNDQKQKSAKESFSLLVRVVNDLTWVMRKWKLNEFVWESMTFCLDLFRAPDLTPHILVLLNEFVYQLVCSGQLMMAKLLRNNILEKVSITTRSLDRPASNSPFSHSLRR